MSPHFPLEIFCHVVSFGLNLLDLGIALGHCWCLGVALGWFGKALGVDWLEIGGFGCSLVALGSHFGLRHRFLIDWGARFAWRQCLNSKFEIKSSTLNMLISIYKLVSLHGCGGLREAVSIN